MLRTVRYGFSLVELSIVLAILGIVTAGGLSVGTVMVEQQANIASNSQLDEIDKALRDYFAFNGFLPCPAPTNVNPGSATFGVAVANCNAGNNIAGTVHVGAVGTPSVRIGNLPARTLGLRDRSIADEFGNRYTYAVTERHTTKAEFELSVLPGPYEGAITIRDGGTFPGSAIATGGTTNGVSYVVFSHGTTGAGAQRYQTGTIPTACVSPSAANAIDNENCDHTVIAADSTFRDARFNNGSQAATYFDDFIRWMPKFRLAAGVTTAGGDLWAESGTDIYAVGSDGDISTKEVGIGVAAPTSKLHIENGAAFLPDSNASAALRLDGSYGGALVFTDTTTNGGIWTTGNGQYLQLDAGGSAAGFSADKAVTIDGTNNWTGFNQNVPTATLHAKIGAALYDGLYLEGASSRYARLMPGNLAAGNFNPLVQANDSGLIFSGGAINTGTMVIGPWANVAAGLRIIGNGSVGIGGDPSEELHLTKNQTSATYIRVTNGNANSNATAGIQFQGDAATQGIWVNPNANISWGGANSLNLGSGAANPISLVTNNSPRLIVAGTGNIGIGGAPNGSDRLAINGDALANNYYLTSDARLKHDITPAFAKAALEVIAGIKPVHFVWNSDNRKDIGVIAQDVEKVMPDAVSMDDKGFRRVAYDKLVLPVIEAVKELHALVRDAISRITKLEEQITALQKENADLKDRVGRLERLLEENKSHKMNDNKNE